MKIIEYTFFSLKIIDSKNTDENILEISDQNRINIGVTPLYFSTNQLKTENKNILENSAQKLINRKICMTPKWISNYSDPIGQEMSACLNFRTRNKT